MNTAEFALRENNTGSFPRGMALMFRAMRTWLHGGDPFEPLAFEEAARRASRPISRPGKRVFETLIREHLLDNQHRTTVLLKADTELAAEGSRRGAGAARCGARLARRGRRSKAVEEQTKKLKALQEEVDPPEALAKIPTLTLRGPADAPTSRSRSSAGRSRACRSTPTSCRPTA